MTSSWSNRKTTACSPTRAPGWSTSATVRRSCSPRAASSRSVGRSAGNEHGTRNEAAVEPTPLPLSLLYWLERWPEQDRPVFGPVPEPVLRTLLASSFNFAVQDGARLERQLDLCWRIATGVPLVRARLPASLLPDAAAEAIEHDAALRLESTA